MLALLWLPHTSDTQGCAACGLAYARLSAVLNTTKSELEVSKETQEKRAESINKVQKAQTKRWLKNEYGVALRAGVEAEVDQVCNHDTLSTSRALQNACRGLVDEHEDELVRAVLDAEPDDAGAAASFCETRVDECGAAELAAAVSAHSRQRKSEAPPAKEWVGRYATVRKLVTSTFSDFVMEKRENQLGEAEEHHVLLLLYHSAPKPTDEHEKKRTYCGPGGGACLPKQYKTAVSEFYKLALRLNASAEKGHITPAEMDLRGNELPQPLDLAEPEGVQLVLYVEGEKATPKLLPAPGEPSLKGVEQSVFRAQVKQFAATWLKDKADARDLVTFSLPTEAEADEEQEKKAVAFKEQAKKKKPAAEASNKKAREAREKAAKQKASAAAAAKKEADPPSPSPSSPPPPPAPPPPPRKRKTTDAKARGQLKAEACEACGLLLGELHTALRARKHHLKLSREAAARKAQKVDRVQKAQTRRWLKQEYNVELAASLEERMEGLCEGKSEEGKRLQAQVCDSADNGAAALRGDAATIAAGGESEAKLDKAACRKRVEARCADLKGDHIEDLMRHVLDADTDAAADAEACLEVLPHCDAARVGHFFQVVEPSGDADEDAADADDAAAAFLARDGGGEDKDEV